MDSNFVLDAAVYLLLLMSVPYLAVHAFHLIRDDCSGATPRSSMTSPNIFGDTS